MSGVDNSLIAAHVRRKWLWRISGVAALLALLVGVIAHQLFAASVLGQSQLYISHLASRLSNNESKERAMGAMVLLGRVSPRVFALAVNGPSSVARPESNALLMRLLAEFGLSELFVLDRQGTVVAYLGRPGRRHAQESVVGSNLSFRPYFVQAMRGQPNTYVAMGNRNGERGFFMAAPIAPDVSTPPVGVVVAKIDFREVDAVLADENTPLVVISPEGVVFASNQADWLFRVDPRSDRQRMLASTRAPLAFVHHAPEPLAISSRGYLQDHLRQGQQVSVALNWGDPSGRWVLSGFVRTFTASSLGVSLFAAIATFLSLFLLGAWVQADRALELYASMLEKKNARLAELTHTDALTGIGNRRLFDRALQEEWSRARRNGQVLSLLMIDVDLFKKYNDQYGHHAGDECLRAVAGAISAQARRPSDRVCRYGGEEFALLLSDADGSSGPVLAESVRAAVEALDMTHGASPHGVVTVSIGVASIVPGDPAAARAFFEASDKALYRAKLNGRNRVEMVDAVAEA